jgi:hypothetical protein|tara:strand:+ start:381 stop:833 length:453 start_codon:yes stop_codon:yes gene_type:complete
MSETSQYIHLAEPNMTVKYSPITKRVQAFYLPGKRSSRPNLIEGRGMVATIDTIDFDGTWLRIDFFTLVMLENMLRAVNPNLTAPTVRRRLRLMVHDEGQLNEMLHVRDQLAADLPLPTIGEWSAVLDDAAHSLFMARAKRLLNQHLGQR